MQFDPCLGCDPDPYAGALGIALLWALPLVFFVLQRQVPKDHWLRRGFCLALLLTALGAIPATLSFSEVIDINAQAHLLTLYVFVAAVVASLLVLAVEVTVHQLAKGDDRDVA